MYKHGLTNTRIFRIWSGMKCRCYSKNFQAYKLYGGRGIKMCEEWKDDVVAFKNWAYSHGYKDNLSIDRIDCNGNYEPSNCRWSTQKEQTNNLRRNIKITYNGFTHTISEWSDITKIPRDLIRERIRRRMELKKVFSNKMLNTGKPKQLSIKFNDIPNCFIHGMSKSKEHKAWRHILSYCYCKSDKAYKNIGGLGIKVCDRWKNSFLNFYYDMGKKPDGFRLVRINLNKDYSKDNCKWSKERTKRRKSSLIRQLPSEALEYFK